ncbi:crossover junction endonuclease MUS81 [Phasianus colchicus]|uniref:crossover junction endonuclease MUS81 n=1 Tax=Phasianus colchicus TaxID=9054 RepID=UPI00129D5CC3|nr:crossover junction endonuclease MUS81 [Phasianus colchicus]
MAADSPAPSGDHAPVSPASSEDSAPSLDSAPSPEGAIEERVELRPGHFEVLLCADVTEGTGPGRSRGALPPLQAVGQRVELRRLPVGDFLWVARETDPPPGGRDFRREGLPVGVVGGAMGGCAGCCEW